MPTKGVILRKHPIAKQETRFNRRIQKSSASFRPILTELQAVGLNRDQDQRRIETKSH